MTIELTQAQETALQQHRLWWLTRFDAQPQGSRLDWADANLSDADLSRADLSDADLSGANFSSSKKIEQANAQWMLEQQQSGAWIINQSQWRTITGCKTAHCMAGILHPEIEEPAEAAALECPTLALYFFKSALTPSQVIAVVSAVADGSHSLWNGSIELMFQN